MILPDINILILAYNAESPQHAEAREWWESTLTGERLIGLTWITILGFVRIMTNRRIFENPLRVEQAIGVVNKWLPKQNVRVLHPTDRHAGILFGLLLRLGTGGDLTTDAHLAALAIEYQAELVSTDTDFARFPGLRWF
ncbi:MAG: type II toxin-antitoxin system VapC family toxin, partial [Bryobacteraceae bacterium]